MQLFVNDLTVMDFSYLCPKRGMVGESWIVDVVLEGALNDESMVQDFGKVKKELKALVDEYVDHKLLVPVDHPFTQITHHARNDDVTVNFNRPDDKDIHLYCPAEAYAFIYAEHVDMDSVSRYLKEVIATHLPENVEGITLHLRTEVIPTPFYHYTHGLKKHDGNCQRIAHGHRSKVIINVDGESNLEIAQYWAQRWKDIYIGSREDLIVATEQTNKCVLKARDTHFLFGYESSQGWFELLIPKLETEIIETDSTVECLAEFMLTETQTYLGNSGSLIKVLAFEGVGKGAMVNA